MKSLAKIIAIVLLVLGCFYIGIVPCIAATDSKQTDQPPIDNADIYGESGSALSNPGEEIWKSTNPATPTQQLLTKKSTRSLDCEPNPNHHRGALLTVKGAKRISYLHCRIPNGQWQDQLSYHLAELYPATETINETSVALEHQGWVALKEDFENQGLPTSQVRGWTNSIDSRKSDSQKMNLAWNGQWRNRDGDIVEYSFSYRIPYTNSTTLLDEQAALKVTYLEVIGIYIPAGQVKALLQFQKEYKATQKGSTP